MGVELSNNKPWELSLYELNRKPQPLITDDSEIAVKPRSLQSELMCPICLDMLKTTMTTKECLHRFCNECITTALRSGNKECPTCRKKLVSRRSLRPDPNFDMLISKIYPSREDYEKNQEFSGSKENANRKNIRGKNQDSSTASETNNNHNSIQQPEIELVFKPLTQGSREDNFISTRFLKTTTNATIDHLIKYLSMRHFLETNPNNCDNNQELDTSLFTIYVAAGPGEFQPLPGQTTLDQVNEKFWRHNKPLELYYAYKMSQL